MQYMGGMIEALTSCLGLMLLDAVERRGAVGWDAIFLLNPGTQGRRSWASSFACLLNVTDFIIRQSKASWPVENK